MRVLDLIWRWERRRLGRRIPDLILVYLASSIIYYSFSFTTTILIPRFLKKPSTGS